MMPQLNKSCVARPPVMGGRWASLALVLSLLLLLLPQVLASPQQQTYPEEVHRLVVARLRAQDSRGGTWGEWSAWSPCSRSCGRGIATQSRECLMTHRSRSRRQASTGSRCVGLYKRFQLCNTQECPGGFTDYRRVQCGSFNKTPFNRRFYTWEPYYDSSESCSLNCRAVGLSFYATLNQTVVDGTSCGPDPTSERLCVAGRCMELGCDGVLGSGRFLDECGVCGGDNSTCRVIAGVFSRARMPYGYNLIATLPPGATNITIEQVQPSSNYLSLRSKEGDFFINGNWGVNVSGDYTAAGTVFNYLRPQHFQGDRVMAVGPLQEPVDIMLFYQSNNSGIKYEYRLPMTGSRSNSGSNVRGNNRQRAPIQPRRPDNPLNPYVPGGPAARAPPSGTAHSHMSPKINPLYGQTSKTNNDLRSMNAIMSPMQNPPFHSAYTTQQRPMTAYSAYSKLSQPGPTQSMTPTSFSSSSSSTLFKQTPLGPGGYQSHQPYSRNPNFQERYPKSNLIPTVNMHGKQHHAFSKNHKQQHPRYHAPMSRLMSTKNNLMHRRKSIPAVLSGVAGTVTPLLDPSRVSSDQTLGR